jgi:hypothetical protein
MVDENEDGDNEIPLVRSLRKQIGALSADRDCLRYLLKEEREKSAKEIEGLKRQIDGLQKKICTIASLFMTQPQHRSS